jgi:polysaccharide export outer membrane protein
MCIQLHGIPHIQEITTMAKFPAILAVFVVLIMQGSQAAASDSENTIKDAYQIQPGDVLEISVWKEETMLRQVLVRPDGGLSYPLVGELQAAGKSVGELQALVTERLTRYIPDPVVTVSTQQLSGNKVYVVGRVQRPGEFVANRYMDVVQALSVAGGMTPYAASNKIKVLRRENGKLTAIPFRYGEIEKGENLEQNIILQSGDVVLVP